MLFSDWGIIIKSLPYLEKHKIVTALTQDHGLVSTIALNAEGSRRFSASLTLFSISQWTWSKKPTQSLSTLSSSTEIKLFSNLHTRYEKLLLGCLWVEIFFRINYLEGQTWPSQLLRSALNALDGISSNPFNCHQLHLLLNSFLAKLFFQLGMMKNFTSCFYCDEPSSYLQLTGLLSCKKCNQSGKLLPKSQIQQLKLLSELKFQELLDQPEFFVDTDHYLLFEILNHFLIHQVPGFQTKPLSQISRLGLTKECKISAPIFF